MARPGDPRPPARPGRQRVRRPAAPRTRPRPAQRGRAAAARGIPRRGARGTGALAAGARTHLRGFRQATILAVAITAFILLLFDADNGSGAQEPPPADTPTADVRAVPDTVAIIEGVAVEDLVAAEMEEEEEVPAEAVPQVALEEALDTLRTLWVSFLSNLPRVLVAFLVLLFAWGITRLLRPLIRRVLRGWERSNAAVALWGVATWLVAIGVAVSVLVGDIRALVGSLGLVGLALSWALQTPIESFTGWLLNSFQGYYRVGDRVAVGEVFGDVYRIDVLTTTVWEIGSPDREGFVAAEQPTGRMITFPNYEVLRGSIVNLTRDFPYVWDELSIAVANKSDLTYSMEVLRRVAEEVIGDQMIEPARRYREVLRRKGLDFEIAEGPEVFVSLDDSWTNMTVRYLVAARERRRWKSRLAKAAMEAYTADEHAEKILAVFPRRQLQLIGPDGKPREVPGVGADGGMPDEADAK